MDLLNDNDIHTLINEVYDPEKDEYRLEIDRQWRIIRGDLEYFVQNHLKRTFPKTFNQFTIADNNIAKKIIDKVSVAYKEPPKRILDQEQDSDFYSDELRRMGSKWAWREYDMYFNYFKYVAMWFSTYENEDGETDVILRPLRPNQFSRVVNTQGQTEVFIVHLGNQEESSETIRGDSRKSNIQDEPEDYKSKDILLWTKDQHVKIRISYGTKNRKLSFMRMPIDGNEEGVNQLGMIPAFFSQEGHPQELPAFNNLADQAITSSVVLSTIVTAMNAQSFGQLVITHPSDQPIPDIMQQGLFTFLKLPQSGPDEPATDAKYINPNPDLGGMMEIYKLHLSRTLDEHGIKGGEAVTGNAKEFASGFDRLLSRLDTTELVQMNQEEYYDREQDLYLLMKAFYDATDKYRFQDEEIDVLYPKPQPFMSEREILENIQKKRDLGIAERYEALIALDPNLTEEAAGEKIAAVDAEKESRRPNFGAMAQQAESEDNEILNRLGGQDADQQE